MGNYKGILFRKAIHCVFGGVVLCVCLTAVNARGQINLPFRNIGPSQTGGRVTTLTGIPGNYLTYYIGAAGGGLWKTTDDGQHWTGIFTHGPSASIGSVAVDPKNLDVIWVGTGENSLRNGAIDGHGLFRSDDGGKTWKLMGFADAGQIVTLSINPDNPNDVLVGIMGHQWGPNENRGIFRTEDGGATWTKVLYVNSLTGCSNIARDPENPEILFAAMWQAYRRPWEMIDGGPGSGVYRSRDDGKTWQKLTEGLPGGPLGKVTVAIAPSHPSTVYALIEAKNGRLWRSNNSGDSWTLVSNNHALSARPFYFNHLAVSPSNENVLYFASLNLLESDDGGKSVHRIDEGVHSDYHAIWVDPKNGKHVFVGTDGGAFETNDGGIGWQKFGNIPFGQYYAVAAAATPGMPPGSPYIICGGLQDNNGWCGPSSNLNRVNVSGIDWRAYIGGDGDYVVPAKSDPDIIYMTAATVSTGAVYRYDVKSGLSQFIRPYWPITHEVGTDKLKYRFSLSTPIAVSRTDPNTVYLGTNVVFKTTDGGQHWRVISPDLTQNVKSKQQIGGGPVEPEISGSENYDVILSVSIARTNPNVLWVGTDDSRVWVTRDDGAHWTNATPQLKSMPDWSRIYQVGVSPFDPGTAYIAVNADRMNNTHIYVYRTHDYGKTWTEIVNGLPANVPGQVVREDPNKKGLLFLGTDRGVYYSLDDGNHWNPANRHFPTTPIWDLHFIKQEHSVVLASHGRGIFVFDNLRPLEEMADAQGKNFYAFTPSPGVLFNTHRWGRPTIPYYSVPNYVPGVHIDYLIKGQGSRSSGGMGPGARHVMAVIKNEQGHVVAHLTGPAREGLNSVVWRMRYESATPLEIEPAQRRRRPSPFRSFGPMVLPGHYTVDLTYNGDTVHQSIVVSPDPRLNIPPETFRRHVEIGVGIRNEMDAMDRMLNQLTSLRRQLESREQASHGNASLSSQIDSLSGKASGLWDKFLTPGIQYSAGEDNLHALMRLYLKIQRTAFEMFGTYAYVPDASLAEAIQSQGSELRANISDYNQLVQTDLRQLNRALTAAGLNPIRGVNTVAVPAAVNLH